MAEATKEKDNKMDSKLEDNKNKISLYDTAAATELLRGLSLAALHTKEKDKQEETTAASPSHESPVHVVSNKMTCSYCSVAFTDRQEQREHYKTDWHRYNLKQSLKGLDTISEENFEKLAGGELSSISGSEAESGTEDSSSYKDKLGLTSSPGATVTQDYDSDDEDRFHVEGMGRRHPKVFFKNHQGELLAIYRCVLHGKRNQAETVEELISMATNMPDHMTWAMFMTAGGHFAGAIFKRNEILVHKTFHRYVVRAKRGTAQSTRDKQGNAPHSGGASLRRYNEAALTEEIQELLVTWSDHLKTCDRIFLRAPSYNKSLYFGGKHAVLDKTDIRIRQIPFPTRRPTFKELQRVHDMLASISLYGQGGNIADHIQTSPKKNAPVKKEEPKTKSKKEFEIPAAVTSDGDASSDDDAADNEDAAGDADPCLHVEDLTIDFTQLQEYNATKKPRRRKKPKSSGTAHIKDTKPKLQDQISYNEEELKVRNSLYTACVVGNGENLKEILADILGKSGGNVTQDRQDQVNSKSQETGDSDSKTGVQNNSNSDTQNTLDTSQEKNQCVPDIESGQSSLEYTDLVKRMLSSTFGDNQRTLLHVAAGANQRNVIQILLLAGVDPAAKDFQGKTAYVTTNDKETRNEFRRFMARYPDKYDYLAAEVPGPLTEEMEQDKKTREAERKRQLKKAKREKNKEKKAEETAKMNEEREKQRYLNLSDREKRALAAEKRLASQMTDQGKAVPVLSRCFQCAADMTGKVPFEYMDYKFCSPKCLKEHRMKSRPS